MSGWTEARAFAGRGSGELWFPFDGRNLSTLPPWFGQTRLKSGTWAEAKTLVVRFQHSHALQASTFANVGIKGPPANMNRSGALDLTFTKRMSGQHHGERQIRSTVDGDSQCNPR
jgi:hypothetical protein